MIAQLTGTVLKAGATSCVLDVGGVGFLAQVTASTAAGLRPGEQATLHTSMVVREDSMTLFGFSDEGDREAFELVQSASGVGPKLALAIVSVLSPGELRRAVQSSDLARLCTVPGIGSKGAQKLVIELKDKVVVLAAGQDAAPSQENPLEPELWRLQVSEGLTGLGWSARDAEAAADNVAHLVEADPGIPVGKLLRAALNSLARR
ncbi:Holliday junction DNA helicase subunit RuvA [Tessaracoccus bendigoensis DSM 12906]|uniref:Holliday junction branch migration complex subunit RuvA n=1 Tax=Tessaracoccus bendigoensis DSM 12906 TaxID=1123357 RepID=A0A1M6CKW3_9ACTN|nr:Holliday junction branch migration protein RuvA [Tessaracoccus bendigoensis]SHI61656.1 Holliday junction DNA helicase subunit RuvA [Tessaracoccus bendigoensis DSM 12906]